MSPHSVDITPEIPQGFVHARPFRQPVLGRSPKTKLGCDKSRVSSDNLEDPPIVEPNPHASKIDMEVSYPKWCAMLVSLVLKTRTPFAAFVARSIRLSRLPPLDATTPTFFPIPLPLACWDRMPEGCSAKKRHSIHLSRAVFVIISALNFWHCGGHVNEVDVFRRVPNAMHRRLFIRVRNLIRSDGFASSFRLPKAGRRFPELVSRLDELSSFLTALGVSSNPYEKSYAGVEVPKDDSVMPELQPFSDLNPDRLFLHGKGGWDISSFLSDSLVMPFLEPASIKSGVDLGDRPKIRDPPEVVAKLAKKWDENGLLLVHKSPIPFGGLTRIFNAHKSESQDRQIGDRRGMNSLESKVPGPSSSLPSGVDVSDLFVDPRRERLLVSITDRRDFYHQIAVTRSKAICNTVGPALPLSLIDDLAAVGTFRADSRSVRYHREKQGDKLGLCVDHPSLLVSPPDDHVWISFNSVLQGDHLGVEVATDGHGNLLRSYGLLQDGVRLTADTPLRSSKQLQGLCIDDFFCVSVEPALSNPETSEAFKAYQTAQKAYKRRSLLGSPQKDIIAQEVGKTIGACVNSGAEARKRGLVTVSAPPEKRVALSFLTLMLCQLSHTSDSLHLCLLGAWVSILAYRRPLMAVLQKSFSLVNQNAFDKNRPRLVRLSRQIANELVLLSVLMPFAVFDLTAEFMDEIFCTDASSLKGAICAAPCRRKVHEVLWKSCKSKGSYMRLLSPIEVVMANLGEFQPDSLSPDIVSPSRPLCYVFDFIEVFAGAALITTELLAMGVSCGPPLDLSFSREYDLESERVMQWLTYLLSAGLLKAFFVCPPCTTFSIMRRPALRDFAFPFGFDPSHPQTRLGNILGHRALQLLRIGWMFDAVGMIEQPFSSKMKNLPSWQAVSKLAEVRTVRTDSCRFGSVHQKGFRLMGLRMNMDRLDKRCRCVGKHVVVQGSLTKASATYTRELAFNIALCFRDAIRSLKLSIQSSLDLDVKGLENQLVNDVALGSDWKVMHSWTFKKQSHINILEMSAVLRLANKLAERRKPLRVVNLVDSFVVRGAASKGRSASLGLTPVIRRLNAVSVAASLFFTLPFVPTRLNVSDDPTRNCQLRSRIPSFTDSLSDSDLFDVAAISGYKRWASNWIRLVLRLNCLSSFRMWDRSIFRQVPLETWYEKVPWTTLDFDSTLGFPGEGPQFRYAFGLRGFFSVSVLPVCVWCGVLLCFLRPVGAVPCRWGCMLLLFVPRGAMAMPIVPGTTGEFAKMQDRNARGPLPEGRPVLPKTGSQRQKFLTAFLDWTVEQQIDFEDMLQNFHTCSEEVNILLTRYGRLLYNNGKSYTQYAETLNAISSWKPSVRRMLQGAWDLGYTWVRAEPSVHHIAMPHQVALAMLTVCLLWGWTSVAGIIALGFGSLLRPGELLALTRGDLLLPRDCDRGISFALVSIKEAKTRFSHARLQSAKLDIEDLLSVVDLCFGDLLPHQKLWPQSGSTLRARFRSLLTALDLMPRPGSNTKELDLGSLRAGGATYILQQTENGELLRRRGRWANYKMMEIYVQELAAVIFLQSLSKSSRDKVFSSARVFLDVLGRAKTFVSAKIPTSTWYVLFTK